MGEAALRVVRRQNNGGAEILELDLRARARWTEMDGVRDRGVPSGLWRSKEQRQGRTGGGVDENDAGD
jgi:hypothetical protein